MFLNYFSPKFELPVADTNLLQKKQVFVCDHCGEKGHKVSSCFKLNPEHRQAYQLKVYKQVDLFIDQTRIKKLSKNVHCILLKFND